MRDFLGTHKWLLIGGTLSGIVLLSPGYYFYQKYHSLETMLKNPRAVGQTGINDLISKVNTHIKLPTDESPEVATVSNREKLQTLDFFKKAENGDKVLLYKKAKMAYLYRPASNQLINMAPIIDSLSGGAAEGVASAAAQTGTSVPVNTVIYNGTATSGYARLYKNKVEKLHTNIKVTKLGNSTGDYTKTEIVDITGKNKALAAQLAKELSGEAVPMPKHESTPEADLLIIAGQ